MLMGPNQDALLGASLAKSLIEFLVEHGNLTNNEALLVLNRTIAIATSGGPTKVSNDVKKYIEEKLKPEFEN